MSLPTPPSRTDPIHLMWPDDTVLCGAVTPKRFWKNWSLNALNWPDLVCAQCVQVWLTPARDRRPHKKKPSRRKKVLAGLLASTVLLQGCAAELARRPITYTLPAGRVYATDLRECEAFGLEATAADPTAADGAVAGGLGGALVGAAFGALLGAALGDAGQGAAWGTAWGASSGALSGAATNAQARDRRRETGIIACLRARGYSDASY